MKEEQKWNQSKLSPERPFTDEEYLHILKMVASTGLPQTKEQLRHVITKCERIRAEATLLNLVLKGKVSLFIRDSDDELTWSVAGRGKIGWN